MHSSAHISINHKINITFIIHRRYIYVHIICCKSYIRIFPVGEAENTGYIACSVVIIPKLPLFNKSKLFIRIRAYILHIICVCNAHTDTVSGFIDKRNIEKAFLISVKSQQNRRLLIFIKHHTVVFIYIIIQIISTT